MPLIFLVGLLAEAGLMVCPVRKEVGAPLSTSCATSVFIGNVLDRFSLFISFIH